MYRGTQFNCGGYGVRDEEEWDIGVVEFQALSKLVSPSQFRFTPYSCTPFRSMLKFVKVATLSEISPGEKNARN